MTERILRFSEREGLKPLPSAYKLGELPYEARNEIKYIFSEELNKFSGIHYGCEPLPDWHKILKDFHVQFLELPVEVFYPENIKSQLFGLLSQGTYNEVLDALEFFINHPILIQHSLRGSLSKLFERKQIAYMLIERDINTRIFVPRTSKEEGVAYLRALQALDTDQFFGSRKSLVEAGYYLGKKEFNNSVRESIHAIESMIRVLTGDKSTKFSDGIRELGKKFSLHPALREGFVKLYGFSSDEDGVRHSSTQETESVDEETAFYFLGSCSSFITLLIHKANKSGLKTEQK